MNLKQLQGKIRKNLDIIILVAVLVAVLIVGYQLAQVSILIITVLVLLTYIVDFTLSKFKRIGDVGAAMINFVLVLLFLPLPTAIIIGIIIAYLSAKPDLYIVTFPLAQITLISMWVMSLLIF